MTLSTSTASQTFPGNGVTQIFPCAFRIFQASDISVSLVNAVTGVSTPLALNSDYTLTGEGDQTGFTLSTSVPVATGTNLLVARNIAYTQPTDFTNQGSFFPTMHEDCADRLGMQIQQLAGGIQRTLQLPDGIYPVASGTLPYPSPLAPLVWNAAGNGLENGSASMTGDMLLRGALASATSSNGSALVGTLQTGTSAFGTTVQKKLQRSLDLLDFVDPVNYAAAVAGTFDLSPALGKAIDEALARGGYTVRLPAGKLRLNSTVTKTVSGLNGLSIEGAGMGLTQLICYDPTGTGLIVIAGASGNWWLNATPSNTFRFAHFSICSTVLNAGYGIQINGGATSGRPAAPCIFDHVETRQLDSINGQAFTAGVRLIDTAGAQFNDCRFFAGGTSNAVGYGVKIEASAAGIDPVDHHFSNCKFFYGAVGVLAGDYIEGLAFSGCIMLGVTNGVKWTTSTGESGLFWTGGHINSTSYAFNLGNLYDIQISGALIYAVSALLLNIGANVTISGNTFYSTTGGGTALTLQGLTGSARGSMIGSNQFSNFTNAITIDAACHNVTVGTNGYSNVTNRVVNSSTDSYVEKRIWAAAPLYTLVGGATFENVTLTIPAGMFLAKPTTGVVSAEAGSTDYVCSYSSAGSSATSFIFRVVRRDGASIAAGSQRFNVIAYE